MKTQALPPRLFSHMAGLPCGGLVVVGGCHFQHMDYFGDGDHALGWQEARIVSVDLNGKEAVAGVPEPPPGYEGDAQELSDEGNEEDFPLASDRSLLGACTIQPPYVRTEECAAPAMVLITLGDDAMQVYTPELVAVKSS